MKKKNLVFKNEEIYLDDELIGFYSWRDEKSSFNPTKKKLFWAAICEHEYQSDDFWWWSENIHSLKARVAKYLENKEKGIKDLPQISEQINRIIMDVHEFAIMNFDNYYSAKANEYRMNKLNYFNFPRKIRERGYAFWNKQLVPMDIYKNL